MEEFIQEETIIQEETTIPEAPVLEPVTPKKSKKRVWLILIAAVVILLAAAYFLTGNLRQYARAKDAYEQGNYEEASALFDDLGDYKDAAQQSAESRYALAERMLKQKQYADALAIYETLDTYEDSVQRVMECCYELGEEALEAKAWEMAIDYFTRATPDYKNAESRRQLAIYEQGHALYMKGEFDQAQTWFDQLEGQWPEKGGPHFVTLDEALDYMSAQAADLPESITVVVKDMPGTYVIHPEALHTPIQQRLGYQFGVVGYDEDSHTITLIPDYYPGQRIVHAWRTGDFSGLTVDEVGTYQKANRLIYQARNADPDPEAMELWIHDWLCQNVEYDSPYEYVYPEDYVGLNELTCVGAILSGKANCQGYTDAFYLLGTLAGLDVCVMFGEAEGGGHCWNGVRLDDELYLVDVTFNDTYFEEPEYWSYIWYNNALDLDTYTVWGGSTLFKGLVFMKDLSHSYYARSESIYADMGEAAYGLLRSYRYNGAGVYHAVVDTPDLTDDDFYKAVANNMATAGVYSIQWYVDLYTYEGDTYIWVEWS